MAYARRREKGVYAFRTPPAHFGYMSGWYRTQMESGNPDAIASTIQHDMTTVSGSCFDYVNYDSLSPLPTWEMKRRDPLHEEHWLVEQISSFGRSAMRKAERVYEHFGMGFVSQQYCPVAWCRNYGVNYTEMMAKFKMLMERSGMGSVPLYYFAVSDESLRNYNVSLPVLWMRYSFLVRFNTGRDIINVYRMMKNSKKVYDIPVFPYPDGLPI